MLCFLCQTGKRSDQTYNKVQLFKEVLERECGQVMDYGDLFTWFWTEIEAEVIALFVTGCWICLDGDPDENGEEIARACAC